MKEQILPELPIVGHLKLSTLDGKHLSHITVTKKRPSRGPLDPFFQHCYDELLAFLSGQQKDINIPLDLSGLSAFQLKVLKEMKKIPYGKVESYKNLAVRMKSKGYQAIGTACGSNPFMLIYPCHRVVGANGPGGFAHGLKMKSELLALESGPDSPSLIAGKTK